jgi:tetratricopeptide (TPR) repeat protein
LALVALGRHSEALTQFDAALAIAPDDIGALHNRANALAELGAFEEALDPCNKVLASDPLHADALNTRRRRARQTAAVSRGSGKL